MKSNFFCDFDGTLIDSSQRLYTLFCRLVPECNLSFEDYWKIKRTRITQRELLTKYFNYNKDESDRVNKLWMSEVESQELLQLDKPLTGVDESIGNLAQEYNLYLVTARQNSDSVMNQITSFGWKSYFTDIFVTHQKVDKATLITNHLKPKKNDWIAGDTGEDILAGKILGVKTIAVTSGTLGAEALKLYDPDLILDSICDVPRLRQEDQP